MFLKRWVDERGHEPMLHSAAKQHDASHTARPPPAPAASNVLFNLIAQGRVELVGLRAQIYNRFAVTHAAGGWGPHTERRIACFPRRPAREYHARCDHYMLVLEPNIGSFYLARPARAPFVPLPAPCNRRLANRRFRPRLIHSCCMPLLLHCHHTRTNAVNFTLGFCVLICFSHACCRCCARLASPT